MKVLTVFSALVLSALGGPGKLSANPNLSIVNGDKAAQDQFPYQISLQRKDNDWIHNCGGSILNKNLIVTAAHCFEVTPETSKYRIRAGLTNLKDSNAQLVQISSYVIHENYIPLASHDVGANDIALVWLVSNLTYSSAIQPISLPQPKTKCFGEATLSGWGALKGMKMPDDLQYAVLPIIENSNCDAIIKKMLFGYTTFDYDSNICTGSKIGHQSACFGDSGGPLVQNNTLVGLVSWGLSPCAAVENAPTVYTNVANFVDWIQGKVRNLPK